MRQHLAELLASAISNSFGSYYGAVLTALTARSRATCQELIKALPNLTSGDVRLALAALVQQHVVNHHADAAGVTSYEPNWENAYNFACRVPTLHTLVQSRFNEQVSEVFSVIALAGTTSVGEVIETLTVSHGELLDKNADPLANGNDHSNSGTTTREAVYAALNLLFNVGYIMRIHHPRHFWPDHDREGEARYEISQARFPTGASVKKERDALLAESNKLLRRWQYEDVSYVPQSALANGSSRKRAYSPDFPDYGNGDGPRPAKRRDINGAGSSSPYMNLDGWLSDHQEALDHELILAVNFEKCAVSLRTERFVRHCGRHYGRATTKVYEALLHNLEQDVPRCYDLLIASDDGVRDIRTGVLEMPSDFDVGLSESISTKDIARMLDINIDLSDGLAKRIDDDVADSVEVSNGSARPGRERDEQQLGVERLRQIHQHLEVLVCDPRGFVQIKQGEWAVPFYSLTQRLIEAEIETAVTHSLGTLPARIVRILKYYGHLELRHIAAKAMVLEDSARAACQLLQHSGWADVQEVPRTNRREVTKSIWLWKYDVLKARERFLGDCYFSMSRLSMRYMTERQKIERVIAKSERTDVEGNEDKFLTTDEKAILAKFSKQSDMITRQMIRMDELVALMRDFSKMEYPHRLWDHGWVDWPSPKYGTEEDDKDDADDAVDEDDHEHEES